MTYRYPPASTSLQGLIELAGDLDGYNSSASVPTIGSLTGDGYGIVSVIANTLRSISGNSSLTIGTNKSGASLALQADTAQTFALLENTGGHATWHLFDGGSDTGATIETISGSTVDFTGPTSGILRLFNNPVGQSFIELETTSVIFAQPQNGNGLMFQDNGGVQIANIKQNGSTNTSLFQSGSTQTSFTIGTNKSGADLILQAGAASTAAILTSSGISVNSLAGFGDGYVVVDNSGNLSFSATAGGGGVSPGTPGQIFVTDGYSDAVFTSLISYDPTHGTITAGGSGSDFKTVIGPRVSNETVQSTIAFLAQATTPTANTWSVAGNGTDTLFGVQSGGTFYFEVPGVSVIATMEGTHGRLTSGGVGSDVAATIGPVAGFETTFGGIIFGNIVNKVGVLSDGTNTYLTALGGWDLEWQSGGNLYGVSGVNMSVGNSFSSGVLNLVANNTTAAILTAASSHALFTVGGNGSDFKTVIGPYPGSETGYAAIHFLAGATSPSGTNIAAYGDGYSTYLNAPSAAGSIGFVINGSSYIGKFDASAERFYVGNDTAASPLVIDWASSLVTEMFSGTTNTSFTIGTAASGGVLNLAADVFTTVVQFAGGSQTVNLRGTPTSLSLGTHLATVGNARMPSEFSIIARDPTNTYDQTVAAQDSNGYLYFGAYTGGGAVVVGPDQSGGSLLLLGNPVAIEAYAGGGALEIYCAAVEWDWGGGLGGFVNWDLNNLAFHNLATTPILWQYACATDVATVALTIQAQSAYSSASVHLTGGDLILASGVPAGAGAPGIVHLQTGATNSLLASLTEIDLLISGHTHVGLTSGVLTFYDPTSHSGVATMTWAEDQMFLGPNQGTSTLTLVSGTGGVATLTLDYDDAEIVVGTNYLLFDSSLSSAVIETQKASAHLDLGGDNGILGIRLSDSHSLISTFGARVHTQITKNSNYTIDSGSTNDNQIWITGTCTITLPNPATFGAGRALELILDFSTVSVGITVAQHASEKINGVAGSLSLVGATFSYTTQFIRSNGTDWVIAP